MSHEQAFCSVCDHQIIPGVACDGMPEECPNHLAHTRKPTQAGRFAVALDSMRGEQDFDSVKSIN